MGHTLLETALSNALVALPLAALAFAASRAAKRPALTHALWLLVLLKLVTPPLFHVSVPLPEVAHTPAAEVAPNESVPPLQPLLAAESSADRAAAEDAFAELAGLPLSEPSAGLGVAGPVWTAPPPAAPPAELAPREPVDVLAWVLGLWFAGAALALGWSVLQIRRFSGFVCGAVPAPPRVTRYVAELCSRIGLARPPVVQMVDGALSPMLWAPTGRARLLLPTELVRRLDDEQMVALLAHELAHLRRRDHWVRHLELVVRALYWWNPLVWWVCRELRQAEEECCDAWVVWALPSASRSYADALVETVDFLSRSKTVVPAAASGAGHCQNLKWRLTMIMRGQTNRSLSAAGRIAVGTLAVAALSLAPAFGQEAGGELRAIEKRLHKAQTKVEKLVAELEALEDKHADLEAAGRADRAEELAGKIRKVRIARDKMRSETDELASRLGLVRSYAVGRGVDAGDGEGEGHGRSYRVSRAGVGGHGHGDAHEHGHEVHDEAIAAIHAGVKALKKAGDAHAAEQLAIVAKHLAEMHEKHGGLVRSLRGAKSLVGSARSDAQVARAYRLREDARADALGRAAGDASEHVAKLHEHFVATDKHMDRVDRLESKVDRLAAMVEKLIHEERAERKADRVEERHERKEHRHEHRSHGR